MATASDNFDRPDNPNDLGPNWSTNLGPITGPLGILSNQAHQRVAGIELGNRWIAQTFTPQQFSQFVINDQTSVNNRRYTAGVRMYLSGAMNFYNGYFAGQANTFTFRNKCVIIKTIATDVAEISTVLAEDLGGPDIAIGDTVYCGVVGSNIIAKVNGVLRLTVSDTDLVTGQPGFITYSPGNQANIDNWLGGDIPSSTGTVPLTGPLQLRRPGLQEDDNLPCRRVVTASYGFYQTQAGELIWGYQIVRKECADWLFLSPGLLYDPSAAAGSRTLNTSFGIRVYALSANKDDSWLHNTTGAQLGGGRPVWTCPGWVESYIPWMGKEVNLLIELHTNGDTLAAGSTIEVALAAYVEG